MHHGTMQVSSITLERWSLNLKKWHTLLRVLYVEQFMKTSGSRLKNRYALITNLSAYFNSDLNDAGSYVQLQFCINY